MLNGFQLCENDATNNRTNYVTSQKQTPQPTEPTLNIISYPKGSGPMANSKMLQISVVPHSESNSQSSGWYSQLLSLYELSGINLVRDPILQL